LQLLPRNSFSGPFEQHGQNLKGLILQLHPQTVFPQLSRLHIQFKNPESENPFHGHPLNR